jgi:hypothetical protein
MNRMFCCNLGASDVINLSAMRQDETDEIPAAHYALRGRRRSNESSVLAAKTIIATDSSINTRRSVQPESLV